MPIELSINTRDSDTGTAIKTVRFFNEIKLNLKYDSVASTFGFVMRYDANNQEHAEIAGVTHFHEAIIQYRHENNSVQKLLTGYILSQNFGHAATPEPLAIGGYSKPGVLEDCEIPVDVYPLENNGLTYRQIVNKILSKFGGKKGIKFRVVASKGRADAKFKTESQKVNAEIKKSTAPESKNIKSYLAELATQMNLVLSHTESGDLLVTTANTDGQPILEIDADQNPGNGYTRISLNFNGQAIHSDITVVRQADDEGGNSAKYTIPNPFCPIVYRPKVTQLTSGNDITIEEAAMNELGKEMKNIVLTVELDRAVINGKFITPNNTIVVKDRENYLYKKTRWFIESVDYTENADGVKCILTCVPPWAYNFYAVNQNGKRNGPYNFFIDPHQNLPRS